MNSCINNILNYFFPNPCLLCDELLVDGSRLCKSCARYLPFFTNGCQLCGMQLQPGEITRCHSCERLAPAYDRTLTLFRYEKPADAWLQHLKFHQGLHIAPLLGDLMWQQHQQTLRQINPQWIIPIPLHRRRLFQRGFNQAVELARPLANALNIPLKTDALVRHRHTQEQSSLDSNQRAANVNNAFRWQSRLVPQRVLLIDDILTTGHTANSAAATIKQAGVAQVTLAVFARA